MVTKIVWKLASMKVRPIRYFNFCLLLLLLWLSLLFKMQSFSSLAKWWSFTDSGFYIAISILSLTLVLLHKLLFFMFMLLLFLMWMVLLILMLLFFCMGDDGNVAVIVAFTTYAAAPIVYIVVELFLQIPVWL